MEKDLFPLRISRNGETASQPPLQSPFPSEAELLHEVLNLRIGTPYPGYHRNPHALTNGARFFYSRRRLVWEIDPHANLLDRLMQPLHHRIAKRLRDSNIEANEIAYNILQRDTEYLTQVTQLDKI